MANPGFAPLNPGSSVGQVRLLVGDGEFKELAQPESGMGDYGWFSDAELAQFLAAGNGSIQRAAGYAIMQLATGFAMKDGRPIKTDDLSVGASTRGTTLMSIAQSFFSEADSLDQAQDASGFLVVSPSRAQCRPEGSMWVI